MEKQHYYYLDFLRFIAALLVVISHARCECFNEYSQLAPESQTFLTKAFFVLCGFATEATTVFFLLSGFLCGGVWTKRLFSSYDDGNKVLSLTNDFAKSRFWRIYPPYIVALFLSCIVRYISGLPVKTLDVVGNILGLQCVCVDDYGGVFWTLPYEIWFYVLVGSIMCFFTKNIKAFFLGVLCLSISCLVFLYLNINIILVLGIGILAFYCKNQEFKIKYWHIIMAWLFVHIIGLLSAESRAFSVPLHKYVNSDFIRILYGLIGMVLFVKIVCRKPMNQISLLVERIGNKCAPFTYSLFITHFTVLEVFKHFCGRFESVSLLSFFCFLSWIIGCLVFAIFFYRCIEVGIAKLRRSFLGGIVVC